MKRYLAKAEGCGDCTYEVEDGRVFLVLDTGGRLNVTELMLVGSNLTDPEEALVDLYTDDGSGEDVSIREVSR